MSAELDIGKLLTAIASVNGHSHPEEWAQAVLDKLAEPEPEKQEGENATS